MFKKLITFFLLFSMVSFVSPSEAGFFKRSKTVKKNAHEQSEKKIEKGILVVEIFASWCPGCKNIQPTLDELVKEVSGIDFIQLDVSTPSRAKASAELAKELKISDFYNANKSKTATVAIIVKKSGEIISVFENNNNLEDYKTSIQQAQTKEKALENPLA